MDKVLSALQSVSTEDIEFFKDSESVMNMKEIRFAEFEILFDNINHSLIKAIKEFFESETIICQKTTKKAGTREIDIAPLIKKYTLKENKLTLSLTAGNQDNWNPSLVMSTFFEKQGIEPIFYSVTRTNIYNKELKQFK